MKFEGILSIFNLRYENVRKYETILHFYWYENSETEFFVKWFNFYKNKIYNIDIYDKIYIESSFLCK